MGFAEMRKKPTQSQVIILHSTCNFMKEHWKPVQLQVSYALALHRVEIEKWE